LQVPISEYNERRALAAAVRPRFLNHTISEDGVEARIGIRLQHASKP
jgi:hypothetical protein